MCQYFAANLFWALPSRFCVTHMVSGYKQMFMRCDCLSKNQPSLHLPVLQEIPFLKFNVRKPTLPWYLPYLLSIIILSHLLAFVQLTDNGWYLSHVGNCFQGTHQFLGQCRYGCVWEDVGMGWVVATAKTVKWHNTNGRVQGDYDVYWQWEQYQVLNAKLEPSVGTISPVRSLYCQ